MPSQLEVTRTVFPVKQFVSWFKQSQIDLRPPFQRRDVWKPKAKSYLIDTVMRGLPLPILILRDKPGISLEPKREVVDGQQRLTALLTYVCPADFPKDKRFVISKAHSSEYANRDFESLPDAAKALVLDYEISTHILPSRVDDQQVLRIFSRLNATGSRLNAQELRNAQYHGVFKQFAFELSLEHLGHWREWSLFADDDFTRMKEVEFTSELIVRILRSTSGANKAQLDAVYRDNDDDFADEAEVRARFRSVMEEISEGYGTRLPKTVFSRATWFYALFGEVHDSMFGSERSAQPPLLVHARPKQLESGFWRKIDGVATSLLSTRDLSPDLVKALTGRTTHLETRRVRAQYLRDQIHGQAEDE